MITHEEFVQTVRDYALGLSQAIPRNWRSQAYVVLTLCRSLHVHRTGKHVSKKEGAHWAQKEFPEWSRLIQSALAWREEQADHASAYADTTRFASFAREQFRM